MSLRQFGLTSRFGAGSHRPAIRAPLDAACQKQMMKARTRGAIVISGQLASLAQDDSRFVWRKRDTAKRDTAKSEGRLSSFRPEAAIYLSLPGIAGSDLTHGKTTVAAPLTRAASMICLARSRPRAGQMCLIGVLHLEYAGVSDAPALIGCHQDVHNGRRSH